jgi:hypothetical protein
MPSLTELVNSSLTSGTFPDACKLSLVIPLLKKDGLDPNNYKNYRPVANLPFLGKVMERVVAIQLTAYLSRNGLQDPLQSAYRPGHSTESALMKIKTDIDMILDEGDAVLMVCLDLSAAFDTIDHELLLTRLETHLGVHGTVLSWLRSYLSNRWQSVVIDSARSKRTPLSVGVPQGSVLGPLLFLLYILPLKTIFEKHRTNRHGYADDTQLYRHLLMKHLASINNEVAKMTSCVAEAREWMLKNKLKINDSKTECILIGSKISLAKLETLNITIRVGDTDIKPSKRINNLGATLDSDHSMKSQVSKVTRSSYFHLRRISKIRTHLDHSTCAKAIHSCVTSRLDYHNGLLTAVPECKLRKLQLLQNNAARLLSRTRRDSHITPVLCQLHWLPVRYRIQYKVLSLVHQAVHSDTAPVYLQDFIALHQPVRNLRSGSQPFILSVPKHKRKVGECAFTTLGANLWNSLPADARCATSKNSFRRLLKTHLFTLAYNM